MISREFRTQIFKTESQWKSGLFYRLNMEKEITLYSVPSFSKWIQVLNEKTYIFCWDKIPGNDEDRLKEFLIQNYCVEWVRAAIIEKIDENRIKLSIEDKYVLLQLKNEKTRMNLFISDGRRYEFFVENENGRLNVYTRINPIALALDECGQVYFIDATTCRFYRYGQSFEIISCLGRCGSDYGKFNNPQKIIFDKFTILVLDSGNKRIQAFSRENYQIEFVIFKYKNHELKTPVDFVQDKKGNIYILDKKGHKDFRIHKYDKHGIELEFNETYLKKLNEPVGLAVDKENILYILDIMCSEVENNAYGICIHKFSEEGIYLGLLGDIKIPQEDGEPRNFNPSVITIDRKGNIFIVEEDTGLIHQFAPDGSYIGTIQIPDSDDRITGIAVDPRGNLYASCYKGIAFFSTQEKFSKEKGCYYSKTLDSGKEKCQWHRLFIEGDIPPKAIIEVYYYSSDDSTKKRRIDGILSDTKSSIKKKKEDIEKEIPKSKWIGPEILFRKENASSSDKAGKNRLDMLFREKTERYLWLNLVLSTFDENVSPTVTQMKVFYPRNSYLRYLPAIYQEDPVSRDFLERFLSIFETVFYDLETKISEIYKYFDPSTDESKDFLSWLASWMNVAIEEKWDDEIKRRFILSAYTLYKQKGTPSGIEKLIEIYTGKRPIILEHSRIGKPMVLKEKGTFILGLGSLLLKTPVRGFRIGEDSILGRAALIDGDLPELSGNPFLPLAHRFTVILDLPEEYFTLHEKSLRRILDREKPAHTECYLRSASEMEGMSTRLADQEHFRLGDNSIIGSGILFMGGEHGGKVERHARVEKDTELI